MERGRRRPAHFAVLVISVLAAISAHAATQPPDVLVIGGAATADTAIVVPVYVRDTSGTLLGSDTALRIQVIQFRVVFSDPKLIAGCSSQTISQCDVTFVPAGALTGKTASSLTQIRDSDSFTVRAVYPPSTDSLSFAQDADAPGDLIGRLSIKLIAAQSQTTPNLLLTLDPDVTRLEDNRNDGTFVETVANGMLGLIDGFIAFGSSCTASPSDEAFKWSGPVSGCTAAVSTCQIDEPVSFQTVPDGLSAPLACDQQYWTFDDKSVGAGSEVAHSFSTKGFHRVALRPTNDNGFSTQEQRVSVATTTCIPVPSGSVTITWLGSQGCNPAKACKSGEQIAFSLVPFGYEFSGCESVSWSFGDGSASVRGLRPVKTYSAGGSYGITVSIISGGIRTAPRTTIVVEASAGTGGSCTPVPSSAVFIGWVGSQGCFLGVSCATGEQIFFDPATFGFTFSGCETFQWDFGDGSPQATVKNPVHSYLNGGSYQVQLTVTAESVATPVAAAVTVASGATGCVPTGCTIAVPIGGYVGAPVQFSGGVSPSDCSSKFPVEWTFGDGTSGSSTLVQHTYVVPGVYPWTMTTSVCTRSGSITIIVPLRRHSS